MLTKQNIAILTTSRSEYYQITPLLDILSKIEMYSCILFVSGSHLSTKFGKTEEDIKSDNLLPYERLPILLDDDSKLGAVLTAGIAVQMIGSALERNKTDLLILAGDRYETLAAALAAVSINVPIAHIHGGERTDGSIDDICRHAITKLSSLHFVSTDVYRKRVIQMGEIPNRVFTVGAPLIDRLMTTPILQEFVLSKSLGIKISHPLALVAYHPVTAQKSDDYLVCNHILESVAQKCNTIILTGPNHDSGYGKILNLLKAYASSCEKTFFFENLGSQLFFSVMACADIMIGNSSSGIHEAASFELSVVNVGTRQANRLTPKNVINCNSDRFSIDKAISLALSDEFKKKIEGLKNPYGNGHSGKKIVDYLESFVPFKENLHKIFYDSKEIQASISDWNKKYHA